MGLSEQPYDMALASNIRGQKPWRRLLAAALRGALLFAVVLALGGLVVGGIAATAPGSANEQQAAAVTGHPEIKPLWCPISYDDGHAKNPMYPVAIGLVTRRACGRLKREG
ncbi:hypothetical protein [Pikeienuella sp. HZG-20]|uniref:hypothetical protein n=1 Tax=Paludibacillus litoralis TaxID=3133267 RepID=UPI0030EDE365